MSLCQSFFSTRQTLSSSQFLQACFYTQDEIFLCGGKITDESRSCHTLALGEYIRDVSISRRCCLESAFTWVDRDFAKFLSLKSGNNSLFQRTTFISSYLKKSLKQYEENMRNGKQDKNTQDSTCSLQGTNIPNFASKSIFLFTPISLQYFSKNCMKPNISVNHTNISIVWIETCNSFYCCF